MNQNLKFRQAQFHWGKANLDRVYSSRHPEPMKYLPHPFTERPQHPRGVSRGGNPSRAR